VLSAVFIAHIPNIMVFDFDLRLFCENLKATKPPYECPAPGCGRVYKTYIGIQFHLFNYDHENPDGKSSSTPGNSDQSKQQDASKKAHHRQVRCPLSPSRVNQDESEHELSSSSLSPHNVSAKSQRVVEVNLDGCVHRVDVYEPMNVVVRQQQASASAESVDKKPSELVACRTVSDDPPPDAPKIGDTVPVLVLSDAASSLTTNDAVTNDSLETESKHNVADVPAENVTAFKSDPEKVESICADEGYTDVKANDMIKTTLATCSESASECLPPDSCIIINGNTSSIPSDPVMHDIHAVEVKSETEHEEPTKSPAECVEKNASCSDDTDTPVSSTESVNTNIVTTTCAQSAEGDTDIVKNHDTVSTSTAVVSKSAPTKISLPSAEFKVLTEYVRPPKIAATAQRPQYYKFTERTTEELDAVIEYDMDEEVNIAFILYFFAF